MPRKLVLVGMAAVAAAFCIALPLGYVVHAKYPTVPDEVFGASVIALIVLISFSIARIALGKNFGMPKTMPGDRPPRYSKAPPDPGREARMKKLKEEGERAMVEIRARRRIRIAQLLADPAKAKYAAHVEKGQDWSDEQIAYNEDPNLTGTCPHLQPIEHAMRMAGIRPRLLVKSWKENFASRLRVKTDCCVHKQQLQLPASVEYREGFYPERWQYDNPWAELTCSACGSAIELVHPEWPRKTTKWFP